MSRFVPFMDKENSELDVLAQARGLGPRSAPVGKMFQSGMHQVTPMPNRRALGDRNSRDLTGLMQKHLGSKIPVPARCLNPPEPACKPRVHKANRQQHVLQQHQVTESEAQVEEDYPPIEHMPVVKEEEDTFDDVWSCVTRPDTYIEEIRAWRPSQLLPCRGWESALDDHFLYKADMDSSLEDIRIQDLTAEEPDCDIVWESDFDTRRVAALPPLQDLFDEQDTINGFSVLE